MSSDSINRVPPAGSDPLRTPATTGVPAIKRQHDQKQRDKDSPDPENPPQDPEDHLDLSIAPPVTDDDSDADNPDRFWMPLSDVRDLLSQHEQHYPPTEFARLQAQLAFLDTHKVPSVYWPPHIPLQEAITRACQTVQMPPF